MSRFLRRFHVLAAIIFCLLLTTFQVSLAYAADEKTPLNESCTELLKEIPNSDLIYDWDRKSVPNIKAWLAQLNSAFPTDLQFSDEQLKGLLNRFSHDHEEQMELHQLLDPRFAEDHYATVQPGGLGEWEKPLHDWLAGILQTPELSREEILERQKQYRRFSGFNPMQEHRHQKLIQEVAALEAKIGQKVATESEVRYGAREERLANYLLGRVRGYLDAKILPTISILELKNKLALITSRFHESERWGDLNGLAAQVARLNDPKIFEEINYYVSVIQSESLYFPRGSLVRARFLSWLHGESPSYFATVEGLIAKTVQHAFEIFSGEGLSPHYIGKFRFYSLGATLGAEVEEKGLEAMKKNFESIDWNGMQISLLGRWQTAHTTFIPGLPIGDKNEIVRSHEYVFGIEFKDSYQTRRLAVRVKPKFEKGSEGMLLEEATYKDLLDLEVSEIRETLRSPRAQDGFQTQPMDLTEPLVQLSEANGATDLRVAPTQIFIDHVPSSRGNDSQLSEVAIGRLVADRIFGAPADGEYAKIRLFYEGRQILPGDIFLKMIERSPGKQVFATDIKTGLMTRQRLRLERDSINNFYVFSISRYQGFGPFALKTRQWQGTYRP